MILKTKKVILQLNDCSNINILFFAEFYLKKYNYITYIYISVNEN
jgi:hypothetical protein